MNGSSMLCYAITTNHLTIVKLLVESGAEVNHTYGKGESVMGVAITFGNLEIVKLLVDSGVDL